MPITLTQEYSRALAALEGAEFQKEVNARLATVIIGFQTIPSKPQGDGGLDGLSHNGTHGYCCYGLEHNGFKNNRAREQAVVNKFAGDLRRLFELEAKGRTLVHKATPELQTIPGSEAAATAHRFDHELVRESSGDRPARGKARGIQGGQSVSIR